MKYIKIILILAITVTMSLTFLFKDKIPSNVFCFLDIGTHRLPPSFIEVNSSEAIGQSFVANFDNLFKISVFVNKENARQDTTLFLHLKDKSRNKELFSKVLTLEQIKPEFNDFYQIPPDPALNGGFHYHIQFPVIKDAKDKEFYFYFESPNTQKGYGIKLGLWDNRQYYEALTKGQMFVNHKPVKGFLAFRTYNIWDGNFVSLVSEIKGRLLKDKAFLAFYSASLLIILSALIMSCIKFKKF